MPAGKPSHNSFNAKPKPSPTFQIVNSDEREQMNSLHGVGSKASSSKGKPIRVPQPGDRPPSSDDEEGIVSAGRRSASMSSHKDGNRKKAERVPRGSLNGAFQPGLNTIDGKAAESWSHSPSRLPWKTHGLPDAGSSLPKDPPAPKGAPYVKPAVKTTTFYHTSGPSTSRRSDAQTNQPQYRNASGSASAHKRTNAEPIEISDDEHDAAPVAPARGGKAKAAADASRESTAAERGASAQNQPESTGGTAPSTEAGTSKARAVNPTLKDADDGDDQLDLLPAAAASRPAGIVSRLQSKKASAASSALGAPAKRTLQIPKASASSSKEHPVTVKDMRGATVPILRWIVGDIAKIERDQDPRLQCRPDRLEIEWNAQGGAKGMKGVVTIDAGSLAQIQYGGPTAPFLMLKIAHSAKTNHDLRQHFPEWDEKSSSTMHRFIFDLADDTTLDSWPMVAERFEQEKRYPPCPKSLGDITLLPDTAVRTLMNSEDGPVAVADSTKAKKSAHAERPKPRPSAGTANAVAPARSSTRSTAAPAVSRRERSPQGQVRASRAERSPSGGAKGVETRCSSDHEVQPGRRKILPEQEVQRLRYPDDTSVRGVAVFNTDIEKLCDGEFLNDTIIELGLSLLHEKIRQRDAALADQIHIFSSFFYKRLTENKDKAAGFASVRKWAKTNVFNKKYLVVPINEHLHWYLAIVVNPSFCANPEALRAREVEEGQRAADLLGPVERRQTRLSVVKGVVHSDEEMDDAAAATSSSGAPAPVSGRASPLNDVEMAAPAAEQPIPTIELDRGTSPASEHGVSAGAGTTGASTPVHSDVSHMAMKGSGSPSVDQSADLASERTSACDSSELGTPPPQDKRGSHGSAEKSSTRRGVTSVIPEDAMVPASSEGSASSAARGAPHEPVHSSAEGMRVTASRHAASSPIKQRVGATAPEQSSKKRSRAQSSGSGPRPSAGAPSRFIELPDASSDEGEPSARARAAVVSLPNSPAPARQQGEARALGGAVSPSASPRKKARRGDDVSDALTQSGFVISNAGRGKLHGGGGTLIRPGENRTPSPTPPPPSRSGPSTSAAGRAGAQRPTGQSYTSGAKYGKMQRQRESPVKTKSVPQKSVDVTERLHRWLKESTTICIFDSLGGRHGAVRTNLAGYLTRQHFALQPNPTELGELKKEQLLKTEHIDVAMPQQPNLSDCGIFVLHTFECFFAAPQAFIDDVIPSRERDHELWRTDVLPGARARWRDEVEALAVAWETAKRGQDELKKRRKLEAQAAQADSAVPAAPAAQESDAAKEDAASPPAPSAQSSGGVEAV